MESSTIKAVIFDWGGVLIENPAPGLMQYCAEALGVTPHQYTEVHQVLAGPFQLGRSSEQEFWAAVCDRLGRPIPPRSSLWGDAFRASYRARPEMFSLVASLRERGYGTALLSNTESPCVQYFKELGYPMFNVLVFSCVEGLCKPDRRIYDLAVERLRVLAHEALFVDDNPHLVEGAVKAGLVGITFTDGHSLRGQLAAMGLGV